MSPNTHIICSTCGARNEADSNYCDQCSEALGKMSPDTLGIAEKTSGERAEPSSSGLPWFKIFLFVIVIITVGNILGPHGQLHEWFLKRQIAVQDAEQISWANYIDAEAIVGQSIPTGPVLADVKSFDGIHALSFLDLKSEESITVLSSDSGTDIAPNGVKLGILMQRKSSLFMVAMKPKGKYVTCLLSR